MWGVDGSDTPERIEIELVPRGSAEQGPAGAERPEWESGEEPPRSPSSWWAGDRSRLLVTALLVGAVGLLVGWLLGRTTDGDSAAPSSETVAEEVTDTTIEEESESPFPTVETLPSPATTRAPTTTTTSPAPTVSDVEIDPRVAGMPLRLVGLGFDSHLVELDLAASTLTEREVPRTSGFDTELIVAGDDWVLLPRNTSPRMLVLHDDGTESELDVGDQWALIPIAGTDEFWRTGFQQGFMDALTYQRIDIEGRPVGDPIEMPWRSWAIAADPSGGLVTLQSGKVYLVDETGATQLALGEFMGISEQIVLVWDCDEEMICGLFSVDRDTGSVRPVPADPTLPPGAAIEPMAAWGPSRHSSMSPDGRSIVVVVPTADRAQMGVLDVESGAFTPLSDDFASSSTAWSPDSRYVFHLDDGVVTAFDLATGEEFPLLDDGLTWMSLVGRPAGDGSGAEGDGSGAEEAVEG